MARYLGFQLPINHPLSAATPLKAHLPKSPGNKSSATSRNQIACAKTCAVFPRAPITSAPPYDKDNAEWIAAQLKSWGLDAQIETFDTLFPSPKERSLELLEPVKYTAKLEEPALAIDPTTNQESEQLPTYNAFSIDGDVTAPIVYVNYGSPDDYKQLDRLGISVQGAIVLARYGLTWRGIKPKVAAEHGAIGCPIYSDPHEDGYFEGDVYPKGAGPLIELTERTPKISVMKTPIRCREPPRL